MLGHELLLTTGNDKCQFTKFEMELNFVELKSGCLELKFDISTDSGEPISLRTCDLVFTNCCHLVVSSQSVTKSEVHFKCLPDIVPPFYTTD